MTRTKDEMDSTSNPAVWKKAHRDQVANGTGKCSLCPPHDRENRTRAKRTSKPKKNDHRRQDMPRPPRVGPAPEQREQVVAKLGEGPAATGASAQAAKAHLGVQGPKADPGNAAAALRAIGEFVLEYPRERYGTARPSDVGQILGLSEALLQAMALLLRKDPERLRRALEAVVYGDLSEEALAEARRSLGILNRKTLPELLEGTEPYDWGGVDPETLGAPVRHTPQGPVVEWPEGYWDRPPLDKDDVRAFEGAIRRITPDELGAHATAAEATHGEAFEALAKEAVPRAARKRRKG